MEKEGDCKCGEKREQEREGALGEKGGRRKQRETDTHPEVDRNPSHLERLGEAEREREYSGDRSREGRKEGRSLERDVPKETEASW